MPGSVGDREASLLSGAVQSASRSGHHSLSKAPMETDCGSETPHAPSPIAPPRPSLHPSSLHPPLCPARLPQPLSSRRLACSGTPSLWSKSHPHSLPSLSLDLHWAAVATWSLAAVLCKPPSALCPARLCPRLRWAWGAPGTSSATGCILGAEGCCRGGISVTSLAQEHPSPQSPS